MSLCQHLTDSESNVDSDVFISLGLTPRDLQQTSTSIWSSPHHRHIVSTGGVSRRSSLLLHHPSLFVARESCTSHQLCFHAETLIQLVHGVHQFAVVGNPIALKDQLTLLNRVGLKVPLEGGQMLSFASERYWEAFHNWAPSPLSAPVLRSALTPDCSSMRPIQPARLSPT